MVCKQLQEGGLVLLLRIICSVRDHLVWLFLLVVHHHRNAKPFGFGCLLDLFPLHIAQNLESVSEFFFVKHDSVGFPSCEKVLITLQTELANKVFVVL